MIRIGLTISYIAHISWFRTSYIPEYSSASAYLVPSTQVVVDLSLNAYANARAHHDQKKKHALKQSKTLEANVKAFKAAEKRTATALTQACLIYCILLLSVTIAQCSKELNGRDAFTPLTVFLFMLRSCSVSFYTQVREVILYKELHY